MTTTTHPLDAERLSLIYQLVSHTPEVIRENQGGWALDRIEAIASLEADMIEQDVDFGPSFNVPLWEAGHQVWERPEPAWMLD